MGALFSGPPPLPPPPPPPPPMASPPTVADAAQSQAISGNARAMGGGAFGATVTNKGGAQGIGDSSDTTKRSLLG